MSKWMRSVLILLLILAFLPAFFGILAKQSLNKLITDLALPPGVQISLKDYTFGWLSSYAAIQFEINKTSSRYTTDKTLIIVAQGNITHGPLLAHAHGVGLGIARLDLHTDLKDLTGLIPEMQQALPALFKNQQILTARSIFYLNGASATHLKSSPINANAFGDSLQWNGVDIDIHINRQFNTLDVDAKISPLLFSTAQGALLDMAGAHFIAQLARRVDQPWVGEQRFTVPVFYLKDETGAVLRFDHLQLTSLSSLVDELLQASLNIEAQNIIFAGQEITQLYFDFEFENIASQPLLRLTQLMAKSQTLTAQETQVLFQDLLLTLAQGADIKLDYLLNIKEERVQAHALLAFTDIHDTLTASLLDNTQQLLAGLNGLAQLSVPQDIMKAWLSQRMEASKVDAYLSALLQQGLLLARAEMYDFELDYQQGRILLNQRALTQDEIYLLLILLSQGTLSPSTPHASIAP